MQQFSPTSMSLTMQMNVRLVKTSQFLCSFCLIIWHKLGKEHIALDVLNKLSSINVNSPGDSYHSELDVLFTYNTTLVELNLALFR